MPKLWSSKLPTSPFSFHLPTRPLPLSMHLPHIHPFQIRRLTLAYDLHRPPPDKAAQHAPIVIMHGLFGSKQNNRSISK